MAGRIGNQISFLLEAFNQLNEQFQQRGLFRRQVIFAFRHQSVDDGEHTLVFGFGSNRAWQDTEQQFAIDSRIELLALSNSHFKRPSSSRPDATARLPSQRFVPPSLHSDRQQAGRKDVSRGWLPSAPD